MYDVTFKMTQKCKTTREMKNSLSHINLRILCEEIKVEALQILIFMLTLHLESASER